ncbi:class A beta-lactamase-related serine hydrolase [Streptomyces sp. LRE541]|uniref:class A beta-lactamase-related serine hydrolase n=1 Tax=Streptomyces sp. LRE541 TaxID=2931983 RepID=UPI00200EBFDB|nr:class A beta-lactamase-related serine hydrolase [Streptomyces sp. LRE541]UPZ32335.1 class A beta-lactamase-related serine hydrolase [Streptomyces sp. LRE541]
MVPHRARRHGDRPSRARPLGRLGRTALACVVLLGVTGAGTVYVTAQAHDPGELVSSSAASRTKATTEATVEPVTASASAEPTPVSASGDAALADALGSVAVEAGARLSVAVLDTESGRSAVYGDGAFDTASIVKADILAALLLQAQDAGRELTAQEKTYASAMIRESDNASASALWKAIGRARGLAGANERFGLDGTEGGDGALWGLTQTTAADQLTLLRQVFGDADESLLDEGSRAYLRGLMGDIAAGQDWGVSAAGPTGFALKNGWLPRTATGLWDINSVGRVTADGREYLVAVLSDGNSTKAGGISMVESAAKAAVTALTTT